MCACDCVCVRERERWKEREEEEEEEEEEEVLLDGVTQRHAVRRRRKKEVGVCIVDEEKR